MTNTNSPTEQAEGVKLEPCPFCGSEDICIALDSDIHLGICEGCGADGPERFERAEAIDAWNRRTPAPPSGEGEWVLVPRKVTSEMMSALGGGTDPDLLPMFQADWNDLLAAAPTRQAQPSHDVERETVARTIMRVAFQGTERSIDAASAGVLWPWPNCLLAADSILAALSVSSSRGK